MDILGTVYCFHAYKDSAATYLLSNVVILLSLTILYAARGNPGFPDVYPIVLLMSTLFFLAYPLKFFLFSQLPARGIEGLAPLLQSALRSQDALLAALWLAALFGASFSAGVWVFTIIVTPSPRRTHALPTPSRIVAARNLEGTYRTSVAVLVGLLVLSTILMARFDIGVMGRLTGDRLPYRLGGVVYYGRTVFLPCLATYTLVVGVALRRTGSAMLVQILALSALGVSDMLLRTSRGALLYYLTFLALSVWMLRARRVLRIPAWSKAAVLTLAIGGVIAHPYVSRYRVYRSSGQQGIWIGLKEATADVEREDTGPLSRAAHAASATIIRLTGLEMSAVFKYADVQPPKELLRELVDYGGLGQYITRVVFGVPRGVPNAIAPSMIGSLYLIGGEGFVLIGGLAVAVIGCMMWVGVPRIRWICTEVAQVMILVSVIYYMTEGIFENIFYYASVASSVLLISLVAAKPLYELQTPRIGRLKKWSKPAKSGTQSRSGGT